MCTTMLNTMKALEGLFRNTPLAHLRNFSRFATSCVIRAWLTYVMGKSEPRDSTLRNPGTTVIIDNYPRKIGQGREEGGGENLISVGFYNAEMRAVKMRSRRLESREINDP